MKTIKKLHVKASYTVILLDVEVPDEIYNELNENDEFSSEVITQSDTMDWLCANIDENCGLEWSYEISDFETE